MKTAPLAEDFEKIYDALPVSLWVEDFSAIKARFEQLRAEGVDDFARYLADHPDFVDEAISLMRVIDVNRNSLALYKASSKQELIGRLGDVMSQETRQSFGVELLSLWHGEVQLQTESVNRDLEGNRIDILINRGLLPGHERTWGRVLISIIDITNLKRTERRLAASEAHATGLFEYSPISLWLEDHSDLRGELARLRASGVDDIVRYIAENRAEETRLMRMIRVIDMNTRTVELYGARSKHELLSRLDEVFAEASEAQFTKGLLSMWHGELTHQREARNRRLDGEWMNIELAWSVLPGYERDASRVLVSVADITARKQVEASLHHLSTHDSLTGLYNRAYYDQTLQHLELNWDSAVGVVVADINGLKLANDSSGHGAGDRLIRRAGAALLKASGNAGVVARIGGDEFSIVLPGADTTAVTALVRRIEAALAADNAGGEPVLSLAVGAASATTGADLSAAHHLADERMYAAKRNRNTPAA